MPNRWRTREIRERINAPHGAQPVADAVKRLIEGGCHEVTVQQEFGKNWQIEAKRRVSDGGG